MNSDTLQYLASNCAHMHKLYEMIESRTVRHKDGKEEFFKYVPGGPDQDSSFQSVTREEVKAAIGRFLKDHEKPGFDAAKELQADLTKAHAEAGGKTGFARKSRETSPNLVFRSQIRYLMDHVGGPRFDLSKALLVDLPEIYKEICRDLARAL